MNIQNFCETGGLKILAMARLNSCSYSLVLYILNCLVAGIEEVVSSTGELSVLLDAPENQVKNSIEELAHANILSVIKKNENTLILKMILDINKWQNLRSVPERKKNVLTDIKNVHPLVLHDEQSGKESQSRNSGEIHPIEDINVFRRRLEELEDKIRAIARNELEFVQKEKKALTPDEELLLKVLQQHEQPRKQLSLALKIKDRYPNLKRFFEAAKDSIEL